VRILKYPPTTMGLPSAVESSGVLPEESERRPTRSVAPTWCHRMISTSSYSVIDVTLAGNSFAVASNTYLYTGSLPGGVMT